MPPRSLYRLRTLIRRLVVSQRSPNIRDLLRLQILINRLVISPRSLNRRDLHRLQVHIGRLVMSPRSLNRQDLLRLQMLVSRLDRPELQREIRVAENIEYSEWAYAILFSSLSGENENYVHNMKIPDCFFTSDLKSRAEAQRILGDGFEVKRVRGLLKDQGYFIYCTYNGERICMRFSNDFIFNGNDDPILTNLSRDIHMDIGDRLPNAYGVVDLQPLMQLFCIIKSRSIESFDVVVPENKHRSCNVVNSFPYSSSVSFSIIDANCELIDPYNLIFVVINGVYHEIEYTLDFAIVVETINHIMDLNPTVFRPRIV